MIFKKSRRSYIYTGYVINVIKMYINDALKKKKACDLFFEMFYICSNIIPVMRQG